MADQGDGEPQPQRRARKPREAGDVPSPKPKGKAAKASAPKSSAAKAPAAKTTPTKASAPKASAAKASAPKSVAKAKAPKRPTAATKPARTPDVEPAPRRGFGHPIRRRPVRGRHTPAGRPAAPDPGQAAGAGSRSAARGPSTLRAARLRPPRDRSPPCRALLRQREGPTASRRRPALAAARPGRSRRTARQAAAACDAAVGDGPSAVGHRCASPATARRRAPPTAPLRRAPPTARCRRPSPLFAATPDGSGP